jgi:hypothetical protein
MAMTMKQTEIDAAKVETLVVVLKAARLYCPVCPKADTARRTPS